MRLERTFHPVGHGAFYTEKFLLDDGRMEHCVVYDCGCFEAAKKKMSLSGYSQRINNEIDNCFHPDDIIDALFISHLHTDHILGVKHLCDLCDVKRIILPQLFELEKIDMFLASLSDFDDEDSNVIDLVLDSWDVIRSKDQITVSKEQVNNDNDDHIWLYLDSLEGRSIIPSGSLLRLSHNIRWCYQPFNSPVSKSGLNQLKSKLSKFDFIENDCVNFLKLREFIKNYGINKIKAEYQSVFPLENEYSMTLLSGIPESCKDNCEKKCHKACENQPRYCVLNCLYLGDYTINEPGYWDALWNCYGQRLKSVGLIQVPHHGSINNYSDKLYCAILPNKANALNKVCIISADTDDKYGHPDNAALEGIMNNNGIPILVTERSKSVQLFCYNLKKSMNNSITLP